MPPKTRITREMILDAGLAIIREKGHENLNARSIASYLKCSTQPVLYSFKTVDEIRDMVYEIADRFHSEYIMPKGTNKDPLLELGLNYVRFAHDERNLFRFLFQSDKFSGKDMDTLLNDPQLSEVIKVITKQLKIKETKARKMFLTLFCAAHGLASLLANNAMEYDEKLCTNMLESVFKGLMKA